MTKANRPPYFYRLAQLTTGYRAWKMWVGPNWGNAAQHIMAGRVSRSDEDIRKARQFMEEAWCQAQPLARVINLD